MLRDQLDLLWQLQQIDTEIERNKLSLRSLDDGQSLADELEAARRDGEAAEAALRRARTTLRDKELRLAATEADRAKRYEQARASRNSREAEALEKKVEELDRLRSRLEEEIIMLLDEVEQQTEMVAALSAQLSGIQTRLSDRRAAYEGEKERLIGRTRELMAQREALLPQIAPEMQAQYDGLRRRVGTQAVARVVARACSGCHTKVSSGQLLQARQGLMVTTCEVCHRILYTDEQSDRPAEVAE